MRVEKPETIVEGTGFDSIEYKASTKDIGIKIYGDFGTSEGRQIVREKVEFALNLRVRIASGIGLNNVRGL